MGERSSSVSDVSVLPSPQEGHLTAAVVIRLDSPFNMAKNSDAPYSSCVAVSSCLPLASLRVCFPKHFRVGPARSGSAESLPGLLRWRVCEEVGWG